jgi:hypothetical protein
LYLYFSLNRISSHANSVRYIGPEWSYLAILGHDNVSNPLLVDARIEPEPLDVPYEHTHPWFFERTDGFMQQTFRDLVKYNQSLISHSAVYDHRQHGEHRALGAAGADFPHTKKLARRNQADFKTLRAWFDANPDYTLILTSDHGVDEYHYGQYAMHGLTQNGNEPFLMLYNANFQPTSGTLRIDIVDVLPTLVQFFAGVDIPANSMGISYTYVGPELSAHDLRIAARNAMQLHASAKQRGVAVDSAGLRDLLHRTIAAIESNAATSSNQTAVVHAQLRDWLAATKESMYGVIHPPWKQALAAALVSMLCTLTIVVVYNPRLDAFIYEDQFRRFSWELMRVFGVYTAPFTQLMYIYEGWLNTHNNGIMWRLFAPMLSFMLLRVLDAVPPSPLIGAMRRTLYRNAFVLLTAVFVTESFHELVGLFNDEWATLLVGRPVVFSLGAYLLWAYYGRVIDVRSTACAQLVASMTQLGDERRVKQIEQLQARSLVALRRERLVAALLFASACLYIVTDEQKSWYGPLSLVNAIVGPGVHIAALVVFVGAGLLLPLWLLMFCVRDICGLNGEVLPYAGSERLLVPLNIVIFMLNKDSVTNQALLGLFNWQLISIALPLVIATKQLFLFNVAPAVVARPLDSGGAASRQLAGLHSLSHQMASMLALTLPFFASSVFFKDAVNFDVHPFAGRVGLTEYDMFPLLSAAMMLVHKYGIFMLYTICSVTMVRRPTTLGPEARVREMAQSLPPPTPVSRDEPTSEQSSSPSSTTMQHPHNSPDLINACTERHELMLQLLDAQFSHMHTTLALVLMAGMMFVGLFTMLCMLSSKHAREEALSQALLCTTILAAHAALRVQQLVASKVSQWQLQSTTSSSTTNNKKFED